MTETTTPTPTSVSAPGASHGSGQRCYITMWEIDESCGAALVVMRSQGGYYSAAFYPVTFDRTPAGLVAGIISDPMTYLRWRIETTPRYSAKRLREINEETTATLAAHLAAASPKDAAVLARATRAGALGAMNTARAHLRVTCPDLDPARCASEATANWTCLAITYPSGNPRAHAYYQEDIERWEVSSFPDAALAAPYAEDSEVTDADLGAAVVDHYRRTL